MKKEYKEVLESGEEIYIPTWPVDTAIENLGQLGKFIGLDSAMQIAEINIPAVLMALATSSDPENTANLVKHFACSARIDGEKLDLRSYDSFFRGDISLLAEVFAHVIKAQFGDFFALGLAKVASQQL